MGNLHEKDERKGKLLLFAKACRKSEKKKACSMIFKFSNKLEGGFAVAGNVPIFLKTKLFFGPLLYLWKGSTSNIESSP